MALVHKLGVGTLPSGLNRQHRQGPIPSHVKVELRRTQQKLGENLGKTPDETSKSQMVLGRFSLCKMES